MIFTHLVVATAAAAAPAMQTQPPPCPPQRSCDVTLSPAQVFDMAQRYAAAGQLDQAIALLKSVTQDRNPDYRAEARVRIARMEAARGRRTEALSWYRQLLDEKPDAAGVRIEVARLLAASGNEEAARDELRRAEASGLPVETQRFVHRAAYALRSSRAITADLSVGLAPDSNISSQTSAETFTIFDLPFKLSNDARARSGVGLSFAGQLTVRRPTDRAARLVTHLSAIGNLYRDNRYNDVSLLFDTGPEFALGKARVRPAITAGRRIYGVDRLYDLVGPSMVVQLPSGNKAQFTFNGSLIDYAYAPQRRSQSGMVYTYGAAYDRAVTSALAMRTSFSYARVGAADPGYASRNYAADIAGSLDLGRFTLSARAAFTKVRGDADFLIFQKKRDDSIKEVDGSIQFRHLRLLGLSPQLKVTYISSDSAIPLYRYNRVRSEFGLTSLF